MRTSHAVLSLALLSAPPLAAAATIAVPKDQPTIQDAVNAAQSGDVIVVSKGTHGAFTIDGKNDLTVKGKGKPVVDGAGAASTVVTISDSQDVILDGLVIQNSTTRLVDILASQEVTVRRCSFTGGEDGVRAHDGSANVLIEKNHFTGIANDAVDFTADETPSPATNSRVEKNQFESGGDDAIEIEGTGHVIEKNRIRAQGEGGILLTDSAQGVTIAKNRIEDTGETGIEADGTGHTIEKNRLKRVGTNDQEGIQVLGSGHRVEKNKVDTAGDDGIDVEASDCELVSNSVKNAREDGFEIGTVDIPGQTTGNLFERNKVTASGSDGFHVLDTGNTFTRNKASKSGGFDLLDETVAGGNVYDDNKFPNSQIP